MAETIFLSASVPDPKRSPSYARTADIVAITSAVSALAYVTLGRRRLVWGGHPAITPMIVVMFEDLGIEYRDWVTLYQSRFFVNEFPEDNKRFQNVVLTDAVKGDREASLKHMRKRMFSETIYSAGVFIGGMEGIIAEFQMFQQLQPNAKIIPVASTGGAVLDIFGAQVVVDDSLLIERDYIALFHKYLDISVREERFRTPAEQPQTIEDRFWRGIV